MLKEIDNNKISLRFVYTWLSQVEEIDYMLYIRLLKIFYSVENLYIQSNNKNNFRKILIQNNVVLSEKLISQLTSLSLKEKSFKIYNNLIKQDIGIICIEDKRYPKEKFVNMYNPPICLFVYGNISKLNEKIIYLHKEKFNDYGKQIYEMLSEYIIMKNWNFINQFSGICLLNCDVFSECFNIESFIKTDLNLYIFIPNKFNEKSQNKLYITELMVSICNICIIPQAKYDKNLYVKNIVEIFLEQEKSVLVVPGNIYCKYNYLSNYLIKEGAEIILNKYDIDKYL